MRVINVWPIERQSNVGKWQSLKEACQGLHPEVRIGVLTVGIFSCMARLRCVLLYSVNSHTWMGDFCIVLVGNWRHFLYNFPAF